MTTRRAFLRRSFQGFIAASAVGGVLDRFGGTIASAAISGELPESVPAIRAVNIMNFLRASEPRGPMDLVLPLKKQMELIERHGFPATWLLQYDALVTGPFVEYLREHMPDTHETGLWFEMNRALTDAAEVPWKGREGWAWDYHVPVAYTIGYGVGDRRKLADAAMKGFQRVWGETPKSVAAWNLDAWTMDYLSKEYGVEAFAVCRDQITTDGFTIWGAPIAGYYPSRVNAWSPALAKTHQISTPVFRLLGQDPVYAYDQQYRLEPGAEDSDKVLNMIDTMEPVWPAGRSRTFIRNFLRNLAEDPCGAFAYAQLGQENSFGWPEMEKGYRIQMDELAAIAKGGALTVETMSSTGRQFRKAFPVTPMQAQIVLHDPFDRTDPAERTVWYQSRFYRANLHFKGEEVYFRDIVVYSDRYAQPFLETPVTDHGIEQRNLAVLDGYHWRAADGKRAAGWLYLQDTNGDRLKITAVRPPAVTESPAGIQVEISSAEGVTVLVKFEEGEIFLAATGATEGSVLVLGFDWEESALVDVTSGQLAYRYSNFEYFVEIAGGVAARTPTGAEIVSENSALKLKVAQTS